MNKRIKELAEQATTTSFNEDGAGFHRFSKEKFAELIVRECAKVIDNAQSDGVLDDFAMVYFQEHFKGK